MQSIVHAPRGKSIAFCGKSRGVDSHGSYHFIREHYLIYQLAPVNKYPVCGAVRLTV